MGRPPLDLGTAGAIRCYPSAKGFRAMTRYRDWDGRVRQIERHGPSQSAAIRALKRTIRDRSRAAGGAELTPESRMSALAEAWYETLEGRSPSTMQIYHYCLDRYLLPALGQVRVRELTVGLVDRHLSTIAKNSGPSMAKTSRSVLSGVCNLGCRLDLLDSNPCRDTGRISTRPKNPPQALSIERARQLLAYLSYDPKARSRDLPDLVAFMLATGLRIGEASALTWAYVDLEAGTVEVAGTALRLKGQGLVIKHSAKSSAGNRVLVLPRWGVQLLQRRLEACAGAPDDLVFPAPLGGIRDPSNTGADLRDAFSFAGEPALTSHWLRKSVATWMDVAGLSARQAADQLGHAQVSLTQNVYLGRKQRVTGAAQVLEQLDGWVF